MEKENGRKQTLEHPTVDQLHQLRLNAMAMALASQAQQADISQPSFEERLGLLIDMNWPSANPGRTPPT